MEGTNGEDEDQVPALVFSLYVLACMGLGVSKAVISCIIGIYILPIVMNIDYVYYWDVVV